MNTSLFDNRHGTEVLLFATLVGQASISPSHLYIAMAQQQLETFQAHAGIEQFARKGMPETVDHVAFMLQPRSTYILHENIAGLSVT
jgi:hypothetical protein